MVLVRVYIRQQWRNSALIPGCSDSVIAAGTLIGGGGFECISGNCSEVPDDSIRISTNAQCTDYNRQFNYASGTITREIYLPVNLYLQYTFAEGNWIPVLPTGSRSPRLSMSMSIDTHWRENGR